MRAPVTYRRAISVLACTLYSPPLSRCHIFLPLNHQSACKQQCDQLCDVSGLFIYYHLVTLHSRHCQPWLKACDKRSFKTKNKVLQIHDNSFN